MSSSSTASTAPSSKGPKSITNGHTPGDSSTCTKKRGWDDIESIFDQKKQQQLEEKKTKIDNDERSRTKKSSKSNKRPIVNDNNTRINNKGNSHDHRNTDDWVNDGLGGVYNHEGYTGRIEDGVKIFKAHVLSNQKSNTNAGQTKDCPFDCQCCFI